MSTPKRFTRGGVTNVPARATMGNLITMDPTAVHVWMKDFHRYDSNQWLVTRAEGTLSSAIGNLASSMLDTYSSERITDAKNGVLQIKTGTIDDANIFFQYVGDVDQPLIADGTGYKRTDTLPTENFALTAGSKLWYKTRMKLNDVDTCDFQMGLHIQDTSPLATAPSDGVYFQSDDGDAFLDFLVRASSVATYTDVAIATIADDTYFDMGFYYDGSGRIQYFYNDVMIGELTAPTLPTTELAVSFGLQNGSSAQSTMSIDYICTVTER